MNCECTKAAFIILADDCVYYLYCIEVKYR